ncbi:MAG TPA: cell division protein SepF [Iamia sp.]
MWRKAMLYLGLGPDEEYDDYDPGYDDPAPAPARQVQSPPLLHEPEPHPQSAVGAVRPMTPVRPDGGPSDFASQVGAGMGGIGAVTPSSGMGGARPRPKVVRPMPVASSARPRVVVPTSFNQAQTLADTFKGGQPVVMNLRQADREVSRRLIDFSSGLCYGLGGRMEKLDGQVYLVMPASVEVTEDERQRLRDRGYED